MAGVSKPLGLADREEVRVLQSLARGEACLVIEAEQFVQEIDAFRANQVLVFRCHKAVPALLRMPMTRKGGRGGSATGATYVGSVREDYASDGGEEMPATESGRMNSDRGQRGTERGGG